jgi:FtsP/CotA-like multicopper oxidase with cupredoxin domain
MAILPNNLNRRSLLQIGAGGGVAVGGLAALPLLLSSNAQTPEATPGMSHGAHGDESEGHSASTTMGEIDVSALAIDPSDFITSFDYGTVSNRSDRTVVREWEILAIDREIEIAPGVYFPAWTYNGQVPGPTLRANEGDFLRIHFVNGGAHPHTIHFHGIHSAFHDGVTGIGRGDLQPGEEFTYEFFAKPFGCHLYHCHSAPLKRHIHKGLYGAFIVNPDPRKHGDAARSRHPDYPESGEWQEFIMVMNAFDTTFDAANEVYAINSAAFHYMKHPIVIDRARPVRIYLINLTEFDPVNSFHMHANFFNYFDTGTTLEPTLRLVDTIAQVQGQRGILELNFAEHEPGLYMFHAHVSEFAELGWMSAFDVR